MVRWVRERPWVVVFIWTAIVLGISSIPNITAPPGAPTRLDLLAHFVEYLVLGLLLSRALLAEVPWGRPAIFGVALLLGVGIAVLDEFHQRAIPGRSCDAVDMLADACGIFMAQILLIVRK
jgi:VanZ family protein